MRARDAQVLAAVLNLSTDGDEVRFTGTRRKFFEAREARVRQEGIDRLERFDVGRLGSSGARPQAGGLPLSRRARCHFHPPRIGRYDARPFCRPGCGFFDTRDDAEALVTRPEDLPDNAMAATVLLNRGAFTREGRYTDAAERALRIVQPLLGQAPTGFARWLSALDFALGEPKEIAVVGPSTASSTPLRSAQDGEVEKLLDVVFSEYRPNQVVAFVRDGEAAGIPLLEGRTAMDGHATAYVCRNFVCELQATEAKALEGLLKG